MKYPPWSYGHSPISVKRLGFLLYKIQWFDFTIIGISPNLILSSIFVNSNVSLQLLVMVNLIDISQKIEAE